MRPQVARRAGLPADRVCAEVLPGDKASKVEELQVNRLLYGHHVLKIDRQKIAWVGPGRLSRINASNGDGVIQLSTYAVVEGIIYSFLLWSCSMIRSFKGLHS